MTTPQTNPPAHKNRVLQEIMTKAYNTAATSRTRINETTTTLLRKLNAGRFRHQLALENLEVGRNTMLDRILTTWECAAELLNLGGEQYLEEARALQEKADSLVRGPLRFVAAGIEEESFGFQEWEEAALKYLEDLGEEAEGLRRYMIELAGQAQAMGIDIAWWGNPEDPEAKVEHLEEGEILEL